MGTWGVGPFENDGAADLVANLLNHVHKATKPKKNKTAWHFYEEARAAATLIVSAHGTDILGGPSLETILQLLQRMRSDEKYFIGSFRDPRPIVSALNAEIRKVKRLLKERLLKEADAPPQV
jgi:hypothetical protein